MPKSHLWIALTLGLLFAQTSHAAVPIGIEEGRLVRIDREARTEPLPFPLQAVVVFGVAGDHVLVGADPRNMAPGTDGWGGLNLWSVALDGSRSRRLTRGRTVVRAVWSDAARLAAVWTRDMEIRLMDLEGKVVRTIPRGASPAFSPDGGRLAYAQAPQTWKPGGIPGGFDLHVIDLATGADRELTAGYDDAEPIWTPDGRQILFLSGQRTGLTSFWRVGADGGALEQVTNLGRTGIDEKFVPNPSANVEAEWSKDGSRLLYGAHYTEAGEVIVLEFDRSYRALEAKELGAGTSPSWSDRGTVLVLRKGAAGLEVEEIAAEGEAVRKVIPVESGPTPEPSAWQPARGMEQLLSSPADKHHVNPPRYRFPLGFHPAGSRYYYDNDSRSGFIASWKCNGETYDGHRGSDYPAPCGTAIYAGHGGSVWARNDGCANVGAWGNTCGGGFGNYVKLNNGFSWYSIYAHMQAGTPVGFINVGCGQYIGTSYSSGNSTGCHLHFEVQRYGYPLDDPYSGSCSGPQSFWCSEHAEGYGLPSRACC